MVKKESISIIKSRFYQDTFENSLTVFLQEELLHILKDSFSITLRIENINIQYKTFLQLKATLFNPEAMHLL